MMTIKAKTACVIIIGNEILTGRTQDTNLEYIGKKLMEKGIRLRHARIIPDNEQDIVDTINEARKAYDLVITTGGIGPTHDDITSDSIAKAFGVKKVLNAQARARLLAHYKTEENLNESRLRMAHLPQGAGLIDNPVSAAPGFQIENVFVLAGVPSVMRAMLDGILPHVQGGVPIKSRTIGCFIGEGVIASEMSEIAKKYPRLEIGSYPYFRASGFGLSLVIRGEAGDEAEMDAAQEDLCLLIRSHGGDPILHPE